MNITKQNLTFSLLDDGSATSPPLRGPAAERGEQNQDQRVGGNTGHEGTFFGCKSIPICRNLRQSVSSFSKSKPSLVRTKHDQ